MREFLQSRIDDFSQRVEGSLEAAANQSEETASHLEQVDKMLNHALGDVRETKEVIATRLDGVLQYQAQLEEGESFYGCST